MERELTIVTAFFDIGRSNFENNCRTNNKYLEYFKGWARIQNKIIVYTYKEMAKEVKKIRKDYGLLDKTDVVVIDDVTKIDSNLYNRMVEVSNNKAFLDFRYMPNSADNNPLYDYIMLLKSWFIKDAVDKKLAKGLITWLDFGFNHGGETYPNEEEFNFLWKTKLPNNRVTFFSLKDDDLTPIFQVVQSYKVYITGAPFIVPDSLANKLWEALRESVNSLVECGFIDDDQTLMLMASRKCDFIDVIKSKGWNLSLKEYGGNHLTVRDKTIKKVNIKDKLLYKYRVNKRNRRCIKKLKKLFCKDYLD